MPRKRWSAGDFRLARPWVIMSSAPNVIEISGIELQTEIGQGARSIVYRGRRGDRLVAVKLLRRVASGEVQAQAVQVRREAAALASMRHPCFVEILEVGEVRDQPYLVMEYVAGRTLAELLARGKLPESQAVRIGHTVAVALTEIHRRGMVHRDIKPQNILLADAGGLKIIDFGFATHAHTIEDPAQVAGTFLYSAPEQTGMLRRPLDGRADLYALGAVLFECVAGRPPFLLTEVSELLRMHAVVQPPDLRELVPGCSRGLAAIVARLLAKDPDDRYQTGAGLAADLASVDRLGEPPLLGTADDTRESSDDTPLVGRAAELAQLQGLWIRALRGLGGLATIEGEAGSGKSRLIRALFDAVPGAATQPGPATRNEPRRVTPIPGSLFRPATFVPGRPMHGLVTHATPLPTRATPLILTGSCEHNDAAPFAALRQGFGDLVRRLRRLSPGACAEASLRLDEAAGDRRGLLLQFCPELKDMFSRTEPAAPAGAEANDQLHGAIVDYLIALAHQHGGLLLVVDDVQWIDESSLLVLRGLAGRVAAAPLLCLCTLRSGTSERFLREIGPSLGARVQLPPLDASSVGGIVSALLGGGEPGPEIVRQVVTRSDGSPLAVGEYVRAMQSAGLLCPHWGGWRLDADGLEGLRLPGDVLRLIVDRVVGLGADTRAVLAVAAIIGGRFTLDLLTAVADRPRDAIDPAITEAVAARLLERGEAGRYVFVHDRVREALWVGIDDATRRALHQRVALALDRGDATPLADIYARARHYEAGDRSDPARMVAACTAAGLAALADYSSEDAYGALHQAHAVAEQHGLEIEPRLQSALADVCSTTGRLAEAELHIDAALAVRTAPLDQALLHWRQARVRLYDLENERALVDIARAFAAVGGALPRAQLGDFLVTLWTWMIASIMRITGIGYGRATGERRERDRLLGQLHDEAGRILYFEMRDLVFAQLVLRQQRPAARLGVSSEQARADSLYAILLGTLDHRRGAARAASRALRMAQQVGDPATLARVKLYAAWTHEFCGRVAEAEQGLREVLRDDTRWLESWWFITGTETLCVSLWSRGHAREALDLANRAISQIEERSSSRGREREQQLVVLHAMVPAIMAMLGKGDRGALFLDRARAFFTARPSDRFWHTIMVALSLAYHVEQGELGEPIESAIAHVRGLGLHPDRVSFYARYFYAFQVQARQAQVLRASPAERAQALARLETAINELRQAPDHPIWRGFLLPARAVHAWLSGRPGDALTLLSEAETLALAIDHLWLRFEVLRLRARIFVAQGRSAAGEREARFALALAQQHGWDARVDLIRVELGLAGLGSRVGSAASGFDDVQTLKLRRHLDALLELSVASASVRTPAEQARVALDELVRILAAERAYLFLARAGDGALELRAGRDLHGHDLDELAGYSRTVVEAVRQTRAPVVLSSGTQGPFAAAESVRVHDLRSVVAAPLVMKDRLVGVVYLDNRLVRGAFSPDDVEILVSIANHIAIGLETARAAALEVQVAASVRERASLLEHATRSVGIGIALLRDDDSLGEESPTLRQMTAAWPDLADWWVQARSLAPPPAPSPCPRCGVGQHLGRITVDLPTPTGGRQVFELTYTGHSHALAREGGDHVVLISEVTERALADERMRQMNLDLINARDQAMAASRSKSAFLANMSHELRTPLNAIIGYSEILLDEGQGRPGAGDLRKIRTAGNHLLGIISSVLDLSKIEAGKMGVDLEEFDVHGMLAQVLDTARPLVAARDNLLQHRIDPAVQTMISDETKVRQILLNLLSNAAKFTRKGRIELVVSRRMLGGFYVLEFAIHDTGIGIPQDQIARLFEDFQQADNSTTRRYGGTGLGLTIVDRFCSMLGGTIDVESHVNRGSVFRVVLPERVR